MSTNSTYVVEQAGTAERYSAIPKHTSANRRHKIMGWMSDSLEWGHRLIQLTWSTRLALP